MMRTVRTTTYIIAPGLGLSFVNFQLCPNEACAHQSEILRTFAFSLWVSHFNGSPHTNQASGGNLQHADSSVQNPAYLSSQRGRSSVTCVFRLGIP